VRISEKTVELNFCKGLPLVLGRDLFWFGLTQKQEAQAGFDACTKFGATLPLFQIKASRIVLKNGSRRFLAEHDQMQTLRNQVKANRRVYYVLPVVGTTPEVCNGLCFSHCSRYLDVSQLPATIPPPLAKGKTPAIIRKSNCHYIDMAKKLKVATIHSDPFTANLLSPDDLVRAMEIHSQRPSPKTSQDHSDGKRVTNQESSEFDEFWAAMSRIDRTGLVGAYAV
jgi:hypothetical protein